MSRFRVTPLNLRLMKLSSETQGLEFLTIIVGFIPSEPVARGPAEGTSAGVSLAFF